MSDSNVSFNVLKSKQDSSAARLKSFQKYLANNKGLVSAYYKETYGVTDKYVDLILQPKVDQEIQYLLDNAASYIPISQECVGESYSEAKLNTEWYLASFEKGLRNASIGFVVIAANDDLESVLKNISYNLLAGNMVGLALSPNLGKHENLLRFFRGFEQEHPEGLQVIPSLSELEDFGSNQVALINAIGYEQIGDEFKPILVKTGARVLAQTAKSNVCILDKDMDSASLNKAVYDIFDNKIELAGKSPQAISQILVHRSVSSQLIQKLDILIEREFIDNSAVGDFYGNVTTAQVLSELGNQLDKREFANLLEATPKGVFKPLIVVNPKNEALGLKNSKLPVFVIHEYDTKEELMQRVSLKLDPT